MRTVRKSAIVPASCERMFWLVERCEHYPEFLPWCSAAEVLERTPEVTRARLHIDYKGLTTRIATQNAKRAPHAITLSFLEGPFEHFLGEWSFVPLGEGGCRVEFALEYRFAGRTMEALVGPVFGHIAETLVQSFVRRAEDLGAEAP